MSAIRVSECDGRCCAVFPLSVDIVKLVKEPGKWKDRWFILDMLVSLTPVAAKERWEGLGFGESPTQLAHGIHGNQLFTCRHWDEETHKCGAYEDRPVLCREYPYGQACTWCGSTGEAGA